MAQRVRIPHRGRRPFVCHTTPHSDSTSREVPTLFALTIHQIIKNVNTIFVKGWISCRKSKPPGAFAPGGYDFPYSAEII